MSFIRNITLSHTYVNYFLRSNDSFGNTITESNNNLSYTFNFMSDAVITALLHVFPSSGAQFALWHRQLS